MKINLVVQCISIWDFSPVDTDVRLFINDVFVPHIKKRCGYKIVTKNLPESFSLRIVSNQFMPLDIEVDSLPEDKIVLAELALIDASPSATIMLEPPAIVVLGYQYYKVQQIKGDADKVILLFNPNQVNLEGRRFLLQDLASGNEELVILKDALNLQLSLYQADIKGKYEGSMVLLPAFKAANPQILIKPPQRDYPIWFIKDGVKTKTKMVNVN